ncbi:MAG: DUF1015 family protein, partial [Dehalococcoidia bacterium]
MAEVRPFRGIRYNPSFVEDISRVVCPPYDIISPLEAEVLRRRSPYSAVNLELDYKTATAASETNRYTRAAALFRRWLEEGVLLRDPTPAMYALEEEFAFEGRMMRRRGLVAVVCLEEFDKGIVLPHEHTTSGPKADRLALMKATRSNSSPIMALYRDFNNTIGPLLRQGRQGKPTLIAELDGLSHCKLWRVSDLQLISKISAAMASRKIFLADGHHRYETALRFRNEMEASEGPLPPEAAARFVMMILI